MTRWDAARAASRRQLPKPRKMMGPVGDEFAEPPFRDARDGEAWCCQKCGHHCCSCDELAMMQAHNAEHLALYDSMCGFNSVARGEATDSANVPSDHAEHVRQLLERSVTWRSRSTNDHPLRHPVPRVRPQDVQLPRPDLGGWTISQMQVEDGPYVQVAFVPFKVRR